MAKFLKIVANICLYWVSRLIPKKSNQIAFGGWMGRLYSDNPRFLFEYMLAGNYGYIITWIGNKSLQFQLPAGARFLSYGSWQSVWYLLRSKYWVFCQWEYDMTKFPIWGGSICLNLFHGIPLKYIGGMTPKSLAERANAGPVALYKQLWRRIAPFVFPKPKEWMISASADNTRIFADGCPAYFSRDRVLPVGTPRNDFILNCSDKLRAKLRVKYAKMFGYAVQKKVILYAPTFRLTGQKPFMFYDLEPELRGSWGDLLRKTNAVIIEKHHFHVLERYCPKEGVEGIYVVKTAMQNEVDIQELLVVADVLITDYSSLFIDYSLQQKPCIHYAYDLDEYSHADSGLAYDLKDVSGGAVVQTEAHLRNEVEVALKNPIFRPGKRFRELVEYEKGTSCSRIVSFFDLKRAVL